MPPYAGAKSKGGKARDGRRSRSRNTTPSSVISAPAVSGPAITPFLELDTSKLLVNTPSVYSDILERLENKTTSLDTKQFQDIISQLNSLGDGAEKRSDLCSAAMRTLHEQYAELEAEQKEKERQAEQARKLKARQDQRAAAEAAAASQKNGKPKKRKDRGEFEGVEIKREDGAAKPKALSQIDTSTPYDSPSPSKKLRLSPDTSPLSEVANSPDPSPGKSAKASPAKTDVSMDDIEENRVIHKPPAMPQQGFFPDPLAPDPVIYHIRTVTPGMTDEERKEIYSVTAFPTKDLSDQIAGTPPDKDFSNAKPTNQVAANTFLTYVEPYVRPLTEEDMAFLRERGDRATPFLSVPRGKKHYSEIWAEEDGINPPKQDPDKLPANQGRGNVEDVTEENVSTDQVSTGPLHARLLSLLKFEHRSSPTENGATTNGDNLFANGDNDTMDLDGLTNGNDDGEKPLPVAASVAELTGSKSALLKRLDWPESDERLKSELRYLNFLGPDDTVDFDAHNDDDISERLRLLQAELRRVMVVNGARKSRLEKIAQERLAFQEYSTIHEDLDMQVQQAYLKRTRTLGKTKKGGPGGGKPRPGQAALINGIGISRARDIGDNARILMDRRDRWDKCIGPVFQNMSHGVPTKGTTLFDPKLMAQLEKEERERLDDEGE